MITAKEITVWEDNTPNHTYLFDDSMGKIYGYIKQGGTKVEMLSQPMFISTKGRKFKVLEEKPEEDVRVVEGSKGQKYYIKEVNGRLTCSCPGFTFRGKCKHTEV